MLQKPNKAFKSDSQRLAVSLRSSIAKRRSHLNAALCAFKIQGKCESSEWILSNTFCDYRLISADKEA